MAKQVQKWGERDFEEWFLRHPVLPPDERVLVVSRQAAIRSMVDLLCLDRTGRLVLIEAKNETTTRSTLGQALEYLAGLEEATVEDLSEEAGSDLRQRFADEFGGAPLPSALPRHARIVLAAPHFLPSSTILKEWLARHLAGVSIMFVRVQRQDGEFLLEQHEGPQFARARGIKAEGPAMSDRGRAYCVLATGPQPVLWHVGRPEKDGTITLPTGDALTQNAVRVSPRRFLAPQRAIEGLDLADQGTVWKHRSKSQRAVLLGRVRTAEGQRVVVCREMPTGAWAIRAKEEQWLHQGWQEMAEAAPSWRDVAHRLKVSRLRSTLTVP